MTNLSHSFTVDAINKTVDVDVNLNILRRRENISFGANLIPTSVNIAYASSQDISAANSISIADRSTESLYVSNTVIDTGYTTIESSKTFTISTDSFLVTDVFTTTQNTVDVVPLFYKHILDDGKLPRDSDGNIDTGYVLQEIEILDQFLTVKKVTEKSVDYTKGIIYLNLLSEYIDLLNYTLFFIRYKIKTSSNEVVVYTDLLDILPVYNIADFDDLNESLEIINDGRKVYLIDEGTGGFTITLPTISTYAYKQIGTERLEILPPIKGEKDNGWFVRITNNTQYTNIDGTVHKYSIGEFLTQTFNPYPPLKVSLLETPTILTDSLIKLDHPKVIQDDLAELFVSVYINDASGNGLAAYTTDSSLVGTTASNDIVYKQWNRTDLQGIKSIDHYTGIIEIEGIDLEDSYIVQVSYYYSEETYEYSLINFNPLLNQSALIGLTSIFVDPDTPSTEKEQTLYYLHVDDGGKVIESNYSLFDNDTELWEGKTMYYEELPSFLTTASGDVGQANYVDPNTIIYFISSFTTVVSGNNSNFLVLGDISVAPNTSIEDVTTLDSRLRGGGIIETEYDNALNNNIEAQWVWDEGNWDGVPYPGNASYYIEVPVGLLTGAGGSFTQNEIKQIVDRHTAAGIYPAIEAYGVDIAIDSVIPTASGIILKWESNGYQV